MEKKKKIIQSYSIKSQTLNQIIECSPFINREIDLLTIDTEGTDFDVLKSLNITKYKPKIIVIESHLNKIDDILKSEIYIYLIGHKYQLRSWALYSLIFILPISKQVRNR